MKQYEYKEQWERVKVFIKNNLDDNHYSTWIAPLTFYSFNAQTNELKINQPTHFFSEYFQGHQLINLIYSGVQREFGAKVRILFRTMTDSENKLTQTAEAEPVKAEPKMPQPKVHLANEAPTTLQSHDVRPSNLDSHLIDDYTFDNFIEGSSNILLRRVGMSIVQNPKKTTFNPLFIYGHSGVGKTHLVNAIGRAMKEQHPEKRVLYLSAHLFQVQYVDAVRKNSVNDFIRFYQQIDVLIIDDVQEFVGQEKTQLTFFHIFNHLKQNGKQIIMTCDRPPVDLQGMEERLLTRFTWGMLAELEQPDEKLRRGILMNKIHRNGLNIPKDVIEYISKNVTDSVRALEGVINSLLAHSIIFNCDISLELAQRVIGQANRIEKKPITIDEIVAQSCAACHVSREEVMGETRKANVVIARQIAMYLAQKLTDLTTNKIGAFIGKRNHTTVLHSVNAVRDKISVDKKLTQMVQEIEDNVRQHKTIE